MQCSVGATEEMRGSRLADQEVWPPARLLLGIEPALANNTAWSAESPGLFHPDVEASGALVRKPTNRGRHQAGTAAEPSITAARSSSHSDSISYVCVGTKGREKEMFRWTSKLPGFVLFCEESPESGCSREPGRTLRMSPSIVLPAFFCGAVFLWGSEWAVL